MKHPLPSLFILAIVVVVSINAHAVLVSPTPFNPNPTTQQVCGVAALTDSMKNIAQATWVAGSGATITWHLVAGDGAGDVKGQFDPEGGQSFTVDAWPSKTFNTLPSESPKYYNFTFAVPSDLSCAQSPTKLCTFRVSAGSWNSCTMVKICGTDCPVPPPPPKQCTAVSKPLTFCPTVAGASVSAGYSPNDIDNELSATFTSNLANPKVFATPDNGDCKTLYKSFLCTSSLAPCNPQTGAVDTQAQACKQTCEKTMKTCALTKEHANLYDCSTLPSCSGQASKDGGSGGMSSGGKAALSIFIIGLVATVAVLGYVYNKKGQLFGYKYDKDTHKIVKVVSNPHNYTAYQDTE